MGAGGAGMGGCVRGGKRKEKMRVKHKRGGASSQSTHEITCVTYTSSKTTVVRTLRA